MYTRNKLDTITIEKRAYINGKFVQAISGKTLCKNSPIDGSLIDGIAACNVDDVNVSVSAAKNAYISGVWKSLKLDERKAILLKLADLMEKHKEELALLDTYETGRAFQNYYHDSIPKAIEAIRYFAEGIDKYYDYMIPPRGSDFGVVTRVPLGVVGLITPWNDPMVVTSWKFTPALLMGNSVVIKPAEQSSLSILKVGSLTKAAGIPDGVFNVVTGYGIEAGKALALHQDVRGIYFTGSSEVGKLIMQYAGQSNMKKVGLECGGKSPYIVTSNCKKIKEAASVLSANMFYNQGQICSAPSRVILDKRVSEEFVAYLKEECEKFVPGDPFEDTNNVGCIVSKEQWKKVNAYIESGRKEGVACYQAQNEKPHHTDACCIQPTIFTNVDISHRIAREEIFGPVVVIIQADNTKQAIQIANDSNYGLAAAVWTCDIDEAYYVSSRLEAGLVHINSYGNDDNSAPFGGFKESGIGKDKSLFAFDEYSEWKTVWMHFLHGD